MLDPSLNGVHEPQVVRTYGEFLATVSRIVAATVPGTEAEDSEDVRLQMIKVHRAWQSVHTGWERFKNTSFSRIQIEVETTQVTIERTSGAQRQAAVAMVSALMDLAAELAHLAVAMGDVDGTTKRREQKIYRNADRAGCDD